MAEHKCLYEVLLEDLKKSVFGNGDEGIKLKVYTLWKDYEERKATMRTIKYAVITLAIANIGAMIGGALLLYTALAKATGK